MDGEGWSAGTHAWVESLLRPGESVRGVSRLRGGWSSAMRRLDVDGPDGPYALVLRSFVPGFFLRHAEAMLTREADVLGLLAPSAVPAALLRGLDATGALCARPSLLMTCLPGRVRLDDAGARDRAALLARQLAVIHRLAVPPRARPRPYQPWTSPDRVRPPERTARRGLWRRAVDLLRREPPPFTGCFLHRDFHPGNVLFGGEGAGLRVTGVVDWVETSWGPPDLDVAHCASALALLHGPEAGMGFADAYASAGGLTLAEPAAHLYWRVLDALAFAPDAGKVAGPWRELGRRDLTPAVASARLEAYLAALFARYG